MKRFSLLNPPPVFAEFGPDSLKILDGPDGLELSLERADNGRLTALCVERLIASLRVFFGRRTWPARRRILCAIGARGVSLRRLTLPRASGPDLERLVRLQIERDFPLLPEELAWGFLATDIDPSQGKAGALQPGTVLVLVAAVKSDLVQSYEDVFSGCGLTTVFTVGALTRPWAAASQPPATFALLDVGRTGSELVTYSDGVPVALRVLPFGGEKITRAIQDRLGVTRAEAEKLKLALNDTTPAQALSAAPAGESVVPSRRAGPGEVEQSGVKASIPERQPIATSHDPSAPAADVPARDAARAVVAAELAAFIAMIEPGGIQGRLLLTGGGARLIGLPEALARRVGADVTCEVVPLETGEGRSAAILGLRRHHRDHGDDPPLVLRRLAPSIATPGNGRAATARKWLALAAVLAVSCVSLRFVEPLIGTSGLNRRIAELQARQARLPDVDRDLGFLQYLRTNQPPYLELIHALADSAPPGTRLESIALNRRGDLSVRATLRSADQVIAYRSKLDASRQFTSVVVDEQTPSPDQQKVAVRFTGQRATASVRPGAIAGSLPSNSPALTQTTTAAPPAMAVIQTNVVRIPDSN